MYVCVFVRVLEACLILYVTVQTGSCMYATVYVCHVNTFNRQSKYADVFANTRIHSACMHICMYTYTYVGVQGARNDCGVPRRHHD